MAGLIGDAALTLEALIGELSADDRGQRDASDVMKEIKQVREEFMAEWMPLLTSNDAPLSPYRVIWEMMHTFDMKNTIITHDAGSTAFLLPPPCLGGGLGWGSTRFSISLRTAFFSAGNRCASIAKKPNEEAPKKTFGASSLDPHLNRPQDNWGRTSETIDHFEIPTHGRT